MNCEESVSGICFISRTSGNNGVIARVKELEWLEPMPAKALTVALGGSVLSTLYQDEPFYTAFHIACLYPKQPLTPEQMLFYAYLIEANKYRYCYGRQANKTLKDILVPDVSELPDYANKISISDYEFGRKPVFDKKVSLNTERWKWFRYDKIFNIKKGNRLTKADMIEGDINYIGATDSNNGITAKISNDEYIHSANTITVSYNGSIAESFYQPNPFWATDDVNVLYPRFSLTPRIALFLCTIISKEKYRFNYGRKWDKKIMEQSEIKLPVTKDGTPDWQYMEDYIKSLPYSNLI
jgi:hypothetical protein